MSEQAPKMALAVLARRLDSHRSEARCKSASISLDTDMAGRVDAFNPAELLLASLAACMIKGIERVTPVLKFDLRSVEIQMHGTRQDAPPCIDSIEYEILIDTDESDHRLELMHENVKKYGTVYNTIAPGTKINGTLRRAK